MLWLQHTFLLEACFQGAELQKSDPPRWQRLQFVTHTMLTGFGDDRDDCILDLNITA